MMERLLNLLKSPYAVLASATIISLLALIAAFASEAFLGLEPCVLCIYQRWPYALVTLLGIIGLGKKSLLKPMVGLSGLAFLVNSGIAFYHTGVEQKWWMSAVEGCAVVFDTQEPKSILENIMSAPTGNCAEIPWQDPILGLSMANYNVALCLALAALCFVSLLFSRK